MVQQNDLGSTLLEQGNLALYSYLKEACGSYHSLG